MGITWHIYRLAFPAVVIRCFYCNMALWRESAGNSIICPCCGRKEKVERGEDVIRLIFHPSWQDVIWF